MKLNLFTFLILLLCVTFTSKGSFVYQGVKYEVLDETNKTCATCPSGTTLDNLYNDFVLPAHPKDGDTEYTLTEISDYTFDGVIIRNLIIPNTVVKVGRLFGYDTSALSKLTVEDGDDQIEFTQEFIYEGNPIRELYLGRDFNGYHFSIFPRIETLQIGETVKNIPDYAFSGTNISGELKLPPKLESIGQEAFSGTLIKGDLILPPSLRTLYLSSFSRCKGIVKCVYPNTLLDADHIISFQRKIPYSKDDMVQTPDGCIYDSDLTTLLYVPSSLSGTFDIPASVTSLGKYAFASCNKIISVNFSQSLATIGESCFSDCSELAGEIILPMSISELSHYVFSNCGKITSITLPEDINYIGLGVFTDCISLNLINIPKKVENIYPNTFKGCSSLSEISLTSGIKSIGTSAFQDCKSLLSINLSGLNSIGPSAFQGCSSLISIDLPQSVNMLPASLFQGCSSLKDITLLGEVSEIGSAAFQGCDALKNIIITQPLLPSFDSSTFSETNYKNALLTIHEDNFQDYLTSAWSAFRNLMVGDQMSAVFTDGIFDYRAIPHSNDNEAVLIKGNYFELHTATIPDRFNYDENTRYYITMIAQDAFNGCSNLSSLNFSPRSKVEYIGESAFSGCTGIKSLDLPTSLTTISKNAFNGCSSIVTIVMGENVEEIGEGAFAGCEALETIEIPQRLATINSNAFSKCGIKDLMIPASVENIEASAFSDCKALISIEIADSDVPLEVATNAFEGAIALESVKIGRDYSNTPFINSSLKELTVSHCATTVNDNAYKGCNNLEALSLGVNLKKIGDSAFEGCSSLTELVVPPLVSEIGTKAFAEVPLKNISLGHSLINIGDKAFSGAAPERVAITAQTPPAAFNTTFSDYSGLLMVENDKDIEDAYADSDFCWYRFLMSPLKGVERIITEDDLNILPLYDRTIQLHATVYPEDATLPHIFWHSTNTDVVKVDNNGVITFCDNDTSSKQLRSNEPVKIIASTLYSNGPSLEYSIGDTATGLNEIVSSDNYINSDKDSIRIYDINGRRIDKDLESLSTGMYIVKTNNKTYKLIK